MSAAGWAAILQRGRVEFTVDGRRFTVEQHTVAQWAAAIFGGDLEEIVPGMLGDGEFDAWGDVVWSTERLFTQALHERIVNAVISSASGMPWSGAVMLLKTAAAQWRELNGWAQRRSLDLLSLPLHDFCDLLYTKLLDGCKDEQARFALDAALFAPPPDADPDSDELPPGWDEAGSFEQALAAHQRRS